MFGKRWEKPYLPIPPAGHAYRSSHAPEKRVRRQESELQDELGSPYKLTLPTARENDNRGETQRARERFAGPAV